MSADRWAAAALSATLAELGLDAVSAAAAGAPPQPAVVLCDTGPDPEAPWLPAAGRGEAPGAPAPVVMLAARGSDYRRLLAEGVVAVVSRDAPGPVLAAALRAAARGLLVFDPAAAPELARQLRPAAGPVEPLSRRERQVLELVAVGLPNKAIAQRLRISEHTVKFHVAAILAKLHAQSRTDAVVRATRSGLLTL